MPPQNERLRLSNEPTTPQLARKAALRSPKLARGEHARSSLLDPRGMTLASRRRAARLAAVAALLFLSLTAAARADWTTFRGDAGRSGVDSSSVGSLPFAAAWGSQDLGGAIYGEPLVHDGLVIVATETDQVVALNEATGQTAWQASAGTPVPSSRLPCGDISPGSASPRRR